MLEQYPEIMTPQQVADVLQLDTSEVNELLESNEIPAKKIGRFWRIPKPSLINFLDPINESVNSLETIDSHTNKPEISTQNIEDKKTVPSQNIDIQIEPKALEKVYEIKARFDIQFNSGFSNTLLIEPDFNKPPSLTSSRSIWNAVKDKYNNAKKINELDKKFGRIQDIINTFSRLSQACKALDSFYAHLGYFYYLEDDISKAIEYYKKAAWISKENDQYWYAIAILSTRGKQDKLAFYSLEQFFTTASPIKFENAWYIYTGFIFNFNSYAGINKIVNNSKREFSLEEQKLILETAIYLSYLNNKKEFTKYVKNLLNEHSLRSSAIEIFRFFYEKSNNSEIIKFSNSLKTELDEFLIKVRTTTSVQPTIQRPNYVTPGSYYPTSLPKGKNPYARAKRAREYEKDLPKAVTLYKQAIEEGVNISSSVMDLASVLAQLGEHTEAIDTLTKHKHKVLNEQAADNMLINIYQKAGQYEQASKLLEKIYKNTASADLTKRTQLRWQIAYCEMRLENYIKAEKHIRDVIKYQADNVAAKRNLAICLFKQNKFDNAEKVLSPLLRTSPDQKTIQLQELIAQAQNKGYSSANDNIIIQALLSDFTSEVSKFTRFLLSRCDYRGLEGNPNIKIDEHGNKLYTETSDKLKDIRQLESAAKKLGTTYYSERSAYYLTSAKIQEQESSNQFYQHLCRSLTSKADAIIAERKSLDAAKELYAESLSIYDGYRNPNLSEDAYDEQDAVNALSRSLYSCFGSREKVDIAPPKRDDEESPFKWQLQYIDASVNEVLSTHPQKDKVFDMISYLIYRSQYAANRILSSLYKNPSLLLLSKEFLKNRGINVNNIDKLEDFVPLWNSLSEEHSNKFRKISTELSVIRNKFELATVTIEEALKHTNQIIDLSFFELDKQRLASLKPIFTYALELCKQFAFEDRERLCDMINNRCQEFLIEIEASPTHLSIEEIYPVVETVKNTVNKYLNEVYETSAPQLKIRLAEDMDSYSPNDNYQIEVQLVISNQKGCSPAESLEIILDESKLFHLMEKEINLEGSLRGGDSRTVSVPIKIYEKTLEMQAFSLSVQLKYNSRTQENLTTTIDNFSIRLYSQTEFEEIDNPYATYAEGGVVGEREMFYGRDELIVNIANTLQRTNEQSKCVVIFGQKRAGKSSTLEHLRLLLLKESRNLVLNVGNIGSIIDKESKTPFIYQILWGIITKLQYAIEDKIDIGFPSIEIQTMQDIDFYTHPSPLSCFKSIFDDYKRKCSKIENWRNVQIILLIDEFSYIYSQILQGYIPDSFMTNWKALLQENYFSAVLVGQDVMAKFKQQFPNEFGTTQDERVSYLIEEDARRLIDEPIKIGGKQGKSRYVERAIDKIFELTAGSPFYIQIICNRLVEYMNSKRAKVVSDADVERIKNDLVYGVNAISLDKFDNLINSGDISQEAIKDEDIINVLTEIAKNSQTTGDACSRSNIICNTDTPIDEILDDLVKRDVLEHDRSYYRIRVGLFREWLLVHK